MAGIARATAQLFATTGLTPVGGFAAAANGTVTTEAGSSNSLSNIQTGQSGEWAAGWLSATLGASKFPAVEDMNAVDNVFSTQIAYLLERGIPEYDSGTTYNIGDICKGVALSTIFKSLTNANSGNALPTPPASNTYWQYCGDLTNIPLVTPRIILTGATTFYVATTGNDSTGTGLTSGSPWLTIQHAINVLANNYDLAGYVATIQVANGTYTGAIAVEQSFIGGNVNSVVINGNSSTPSNVIIHTTSNDAIYCSQSSLTVQNLEIETTTGGNCLNADVGGLIEFSNIIFGACASSHINVQKGGQIVTAANYTISGNATQHYNSTGNGVIEVNGSPTITVSGTPAFTNFASASLLGNINAAGITFSGSATGVRYSVTLNAVIFTNGGGSTYFPGNSGGSTATGGQYD